MESLVFLARFDRKRWNLFETIRRLLERAGAADAIERGDRVAIKVHMGELGNIRHPRPQIVRAVVDYVKELGGKPFVTDTTTLYHGRRRDAIEYLETAAVNGFTLASVGAPIIIADGLLGRDCRIVKTGGALGEVAVAAAIAEADAMIVISHVKMHLSFGFGGALKNLAMGCVARRTKFAMHAATKPTVNPERCVGCGSCVRHCNWGAITVVEGKARIDYDKCVGCGDCVAACPTGAVTIQWDRTDRILRLAAEAALGVLKTFREGKVVYLNLLTEVTGFCDCGTLLEPQLIPDIGMLSSKDPVAIDQASMDLINGAPGYIYEDGAFKPVPPGTDKARLVWPERNWEVLLEEAERLGLGTRRYKLIEV